MIPLPRMLSCLTLASALVLPLLVLQTPRRAMADDAPATAPAVAPAAPAVAAPAPAVAPEAAAPTAPAVDQALLGQVDDFWHYGLVARYDLAADAGQKILDANPQPADLATAFQTIATKKRQDMDQWLGRWRTIPLPSDAAIKADPSQQAQKDAIVKLKAITDKLVDLVNQGLATHNQDPQYIRSVIVAMSAGVRAYQNNLPRLEKSGELAVRVAINLLRSQRTDDLPYKQTARQAIRDLGRQALNPLLAATEAKDPTLLSDVVLAISDIGYDISLPYLSRLADNMDAPASVRTLARQGIARLAAGQAQTLKPAEQFYNLAERFYYNGALLGAGDKATANIWYWDEDSGLSYTQVPAAIFGDLQAKRCTEYSLKLDPSNDRAVSLWLAANTKREVDLAGAADPTAKDLPDAHYYNVAAGVKYLGDAANRALKDNNAALSLKLVQALEDIVGQSNLSASDSPIARALYFPNRLVRYEAAFTLASSLPTKPFPGSERVVPLLVEALGQTSKPNVLVVAPTTDNQLNNLQAAVKTLGYPVAGATEINAVLAAAANLPSVDMIVVSEDANVPVVINSAAQSVRLQGASILVLTHSLNNPYVVASTQNPLLNSAIWPAKEQLADTLKAEIDKARAHGGAVMLNDQQATSDYARRAAELLAKLAQTRNLAFDLNVAQPGVLAALATDARPEVLQGAGKVLANLDSPSSQAGLLSKALDEATPPEVRISLFKSLAVNAKFFGNHLDAAQASDLQKVVQEAKNVDIRSAAAEARGALNLPADQTKKLILDQSKV